MLTASEAVARSALLREESRGAHSRLDFPVASEEWDHVNVAVRRDGDAMAVRLTETVTLSDDLRALVTK
jgi:succinate dehydrogenase / fumarate reductase flavoprotein subunit